MSLKELTREWLSFYGEGIPRAFGFETIIGREQKINYVTKTLLPLARSDIKIVDPKLPTEFFNDERVVQNLEEVSGRGVEIEILYGPNIDLADNELSRLRKEGKVRLFALKETPAEAFWVVDGRHVLTEEEERPSFFNGVTNSLFLGRELEEEFIRLKEQLQVR